MKALSRYIGDYKALHVVTPQSHPTPMKKNMESLEEPSKKDFPRPPPFLLRYC